MVVVGPFIEIETGFRGFETKQNPVFCILILCIENYLQVYMSLHLQLEMGFARYF